jgi:hypothetical protein
LAALALPWQRTVRLSSLLDFPSADTPMLLRTVLCDVPDAGLIGAWAVRCASVVVLAWGGSLPPAAQSVPAFAQRFRKSYLTLLSSPFLTDWRVEHSEQTAAGGSSGHGWEATRGDIYLQPTMLYSQVNSQVPYPTTTNPHNAMDSHWFIQCLSR